MTGAAISSFLLVVTHRLRHNKKGILKGRSYCPKCKNTLRPAHLVPVFSWLLLRGKCGFCKTKIPAQYLLVEVLSGLSFLILFLKFNFLTTTPQLPILLNLMFFLIITGFFIAIFLYDFFYQEIPDRFSLPAIAIAVIGNLVLEKITPLDMLIGSLTIFSFFLLQFILSKGRAIGGGDLRLGLLMGALLGLKLGLLALFISYIIGGIFATILLLNKTVKGKSQIAFGPFLIVGTYLSILYGEQLLNWYLNIINY
jgi:prepilin signal peptidase PulO-like enzyme (type II secretory pathway)